MTVIANYQVVPSEGCVFLLVHSVCNFFPLGCLPNAISMLLQCDLMISQHRNKILRQWGSQTSSADCFIFKSFRLLTKIYIKIIILLWDCIVN